MMTRTGVGEVVKSWIYLESKPVGFAGWSDIGCEK